MTLRGVAAVTRTSSPPRRARPARGAARASRCRSGSRPAGRSRRRPRGPAPRGSSGSTTSRASSTPGVLEAQRHLGRARPAAHDAPQPAGEDLEVRVPDPGDVAPVGDVVVEDGKDIMFAVLQRERAQHLVGARGVLDQQQQQVAAGELDGLGAAEGGGRRLQAGDDLGRRGAQRGRQRGGAERVVDVVEPGEGQRDLDGRRPAAAASRARRAGRRAPRARPRPSAPGRVAPHASQW